MRWRCEVVLCALLVLALVPAKLATAQLLRLSGPSFVSVGDALRGSASGEGLPFGGSPNVVGSGARAVGMGGAFMAVADDATAASWNPAGLIQLEKPEFSVVYEYNRRHEDYPDRSFLGLKGFNAIQEDNLNYLSLVYPLPHPLFADRNIVLSLGVHRRYNFDRKVEYSVQTQQRIFENIFLFDRQTFEYTQEGSLNALVPAVAIELTKRLSLGVAVNIYDDDILKNEWEETTEREGVFSLASFRTSRLGRFERRSHGFEGINLTYGLLWKPDERWSVALTYQTPFAGEYTRETDNLSFFLGGRNANRFREDARLEFPRAFGVGVAYRTADDRLTLAVDVTRRDWDDFVFVDSVGNKFSGVTGQPRSGYLFSRIVRSGSVSTDFLVIPTVRSPSVDPVYTVRAGAEYVFIDKKRFVQRFLPSVRAGAVYDPQPAAGSPDDVFGLSVGAGVLYGDRVNFDFAYEYRFGNNVRADTFTRFGDAAGDIKEHRFLFSVVYYF